MSDSLPPLLPPVPVPAGSTVPTEQAGPPPRYPAPAPAATRSARGLATAVRRLLVACAAFAGLGIAVEVYGLYALDRYLLGWVEIEALETYDTISVVVSLPASAVTIAAGVCWLVWQYRIASTVVVHAPLRRSPGWHVGSWVIPVIALWFPFQNIKDLAQTTRAQIGLASLGWWWGLWLLASVASSLGERLILVADTAEVLSATLAAFLVGHVATIGAAVFAVRIIARITDAVEPAPR